MSWKELIPTSSQTHKGWGKKKTQKTKQSSLLNLEQLGNLVPIQDEIGRPVELKHHPSRRLRTISSSSCPRPFSPFGSKKKRQLRTKSNYFYRLLNHHTFQKKEKKKIKNTPSRYSNVVLIMGHTVDSLNRIYYYVRVIRSISKIFYRRVKDLKSKFYLY